MMESEVRVVLPNSLPDGGDAPQFLSGGPSIQLSLRFCSSSLPCPFRYAVWWYPTLTTPENCTLTCFCYWTFVKCLLNKISWKWRKTKKAIPKSSSSNDKKVITLYIMLVTWEYFSYKRYKYKILEGKKTPNFFNFTLRFPLSNRM